MGTMVEQKSGFKVSQNVRSLLNLTEELAVPVLYCHQNDRHESDGMEKATANAGFSVGRSTDGGETVDSFYRLAKKAQNFFGGHVVVAGAGYAIKNDCQQVPAISSDLGQLAVIAKSYAGNSWLKLAQAGILPLEFCDPEDYDKLDAYDILEISEVWDQLEEGKETVIFNVSQCRGILVRHKLS